jgi:hypothetical protein
MKTDQIMYCIVAILLGMLLTNMFKNVCGCKVEGVTFKNYKSELHQRCKQLSMNTEMQNDQKYIQNCDNETNAVCKKLSGNPVMRNDPDYIQNCTNKNNNN